jgi:putative ubiquitin-RnfH superfamily antitoxin RatB of RatAB toxin-antitoxin module
MGPADAPGKGEPGPHDACDEATEPAGAAVQGRVAGVQPGGLAIEVVVGLAPRVIQRVALQMSPGSTVRQALDAAAVWAMDASISPAAIESGQWTVGVWGRKERAGHVLRDQDRVELVRQLTVDPKEARRLRYRSAGEKLPRGIQRPKRP